jgi:hypothetical protein
LVTRSKNRGWRLPGLQAVGSGRLELEAGVLDAVGTIEMITDEGVMAGVGVGVSIVGVILLVVPGPNVGLIEVTITVEVEILLGVTLLATESIVMELLNELELSVTVLILDAEDVVVAEDVAGDAELPAEAVVLIEEDVVLVAVGEVVVMVLLKEEELLLEDGVDV